MGDGKTVNVHEGLKRVGATFKAIGVLWLIGWLAAYMARSLSPAASYVFDIHGRDWALWLRYRDRHRLDYSGLCQTTLTDAALLRDLLHTSLCVNHCHMSHC